MLHICRTYIDKYLNVHSPDIINIAINNVIILFRTTKKNEKGVGTFSRHRKKKNLIRVIKLNKRISKKTKRVSEPFPDTEKK